LTVEPARRLLSSVEDVVGFWLLLVLAFGVAGAVLLAVNEWMMRRNDRKAEQSFPDDDDARATYALLRDFEGLSSPHWLSRQWAAKRRHDGR
jgi:hypothetical protein